MTFLRIKDWERTFFLAESNRHEAVTWTRFPVSTDSMRFRRLMSTREGRDAYCVFVVCVQLSARAKAKGVLRVGDTPLDNQDIAAATGLPLKVVEASIELLTSPRIGWLVPTENPDDNGIQPGLQRDSTGQETVYERDLPGPQTGLASARAPAAAKSREDIAAALSSKQGDLCSLLLTLTHLGKPMFDRNAAAAIAQNPNVSRMQVAWVLERMNARAKQGPLDNPAGYVRNMLENQRPPTGWTERYRRKELAEVAVQAAGGGA